MFASSDGYVFVAGDYCQLEFRILAELAKEDKLIKGQMSHILWLIFFIYHYLISLFSLCSLFYVVFNEEDGDPFIEIGKQWLRKQEITKEDRTKVKGRCEL